MDRAYALTVDQLEWMEGISNTKLEELYPRNSPAWLEFVTWERDVDDYRLRRRAAESAARIAETTPAEPIAVRYIPVGQNAPAAVAPGGITKGQVQALSRAIGRCTKEYVSQRVASFADAGIVAAQGERLRELESRVLDAEKRLATAEKRFDGQARHLRNLQSAITNGPIEHTVRLKKSDGEQ